MSPRIKRLHLGYAIVVGLVAVATLQLAACVASVRTPLSTPSSTPLSTPSATPSAAPPHTWSFTTETVAMHVNVLHQLGFHAQPRGNVEVIEQANGIVLIDSGGSPAGAEEVI